MIILNTKSKKPIYNQLYSQLRNKIINGEFKSGTKLPSIRALSKELGVSRNTVDLAYHQLCSEGYIVSRNRSGFFVEAIDFSPIQLLSQKSGFGKSNSIDKGIEDKPVAPLNNKKMSSEPILYDFKYGKLSPDHLPLKHWKRLLNKCLTESKEEIAEYRPMFGEYELRVEILKYLKFYRGVECTVDQIFIGSGIHYCLSMLCQFMSPHIQNVAMEEPGYHVTRSTFLNHGFEVDYIPLESDGIDVNKLEASKAKMVYVTPSHQYPMGMIMPISKRMDLIEWAKVNEGLIIEDDYSCHLRYNSKPAQSLQSLSQDRVVYLGSFSKFLFPSLRMAYMIIPKAHLEAFKKQFEGYPSSVSYIMQNTLARFMDEGHWDRYLKRNRKMQKVKHDLLIQAIKKAFGNRVTIHGANAGLHIMVAFRSNPKKESLVELALDYGVKVYTTSHFWNQEGDQTSHSVVLGYGGMGMDCIQPAVDQLAKAWKDIGIQT